MKRTETLSEWLARNGSPYHETRFAGQPHECEAVNVHNINASERGKLHDLKDYFVSAVVSGLFVELRRRKE